MSRLLEAKLACGFYPERAIEKESRFDRALRVAFERFRALLEGNRGGRRLVSEINRREQAYRLLSPEALDRKIISLRAELKGKSAARAQLVRTFALVREVADRQLGLRHFDVQLIGGWVLCHGMVAEMGTGEGKTLTATLPACAAALVGLPVHIVTVNDYLAQRDAEWMGPIYRSFGLSVGVITQGMSLIERQQAYRCDVTYCTNKELVFDYLKDRLVFGRKPSQGLLNLERLTHQGVRTERLCLRGLGMALVDEVDSILIDEARTPLIISGRGENSYKVQVYQDALQLAGQLNEGEDFSLERLERRIELNDAGRQKLEELTTAYSGFWQGHSRREQLVQQALTALHLFHLDRDYLVKDGKVQIVDEYTGRTMADRSWELGLHQLIEAKEGCDLTTQKEPLARISYQRFFRRYPFLTGMTGTAQEVADELRSVYRLRVVRIPPHKKVIREHWPNRVFATSEKKWQAVIERIGALHQEGRPVLVGTRSVEASEELSRRLHEIDLPHRVLNARQDREEAEIIALAGQHSQVTVATNMAGRGTDIQISDQVRDLGGLHVIATERHSARRIDRQLFGRCGRQGDPASCEAYASLEDDVLAAHRNRLPARMIGPLISTGRLMPASLGSLYASYCQWVTERRHFSARQQLLDLDEMLIDALAFSGQGE